MAQTVMVNFRIPEERYRDWQRMARRRGTTLSAFLRQSVDEACARSAADEQEKQAWRNSLPPCVRDLIGVLPAGRTDVDDAALREAYHAHLEDKYA